MACPPPAEALQLFERANQVWFWDGRTHEAASLYQEAVRLSGNDPVILFQSARAEWALGRLEAARAALDRALAATRNLSRLGLERVTAFRHQLGRGARTGLPGRLRPDDLDVERLATVSLSPTAWAEVAAAAEERGAYGVAFYARDQAKGPITVVDEEKETWRLTKKAEAELGLLETFRECRDGH